MSDYNKETVAKLRQLLKDRGIPSTGLTRKAQIIEKLEEWDGRNATGAESSATPDAAQPEVEEEAVEPATEEAPPEPPKLEDEAVEPAATTAPDATAIAQPAETAEAVVETSASARTEEHTMAEHIEEHTMPERTEEHTMPERMEEHTMPERTEEHTMPERTEEHTMPEAPEEPDASTAPKEASEPATEAADPSQIPSESHATDFARPTQTPSPSPDEKLSIEKPELLPIPERSATTTAEPSRLNTEEREADTRKRKRRSHTPELLAQEVCAKKPRPSEDPVHVVVAPPQDEDIVMDQRPPEPEEAEKELAEQAMEEEAVDKHQEVEKEEPKPETDAEGEAEAGPDDSAEQAAPLPDDLSLPEKKEKAPRYRGDLFQPAADSTPIDAPPDDRSISPALHPATPSLYIRNLMRPLRPEPLRAHLIFLASPPSADPTPNPDIITSLFLDGMKTHALVRFANTAAASRVRASLHNTTWPPEANRKALWVDFIPDDKCAAWITQEEAALSAERQARASGRPIPPKKFEVVYPEAENGACTAVFQEVGAGAGAGAGAAPFNPPKGPRRASHHAPPPPTQDIRQTAHNSFKTLDELFSSTTAKPKLYFLPVSDARVDARLSVLDKATSRDWAPEEKRKGRGMQSSRRDQKARFTFDEEDGVVEAGGDMGPWTEPGDFRGARGGYRGRGRGRGWGGGGGGWRSGGLA